MEIWKDVVGYEGYYEVSNLGNVRSVTRKKKGKQLKPLARQHGYLAVQLWGNGGNKRGFRTFSIHRLVAEAFIPNPNSYPEINHINEIKTDNSVENLEWCTRKQNMNSGTLKDRMRGRKLGNARPIIQFDLEMNQIAEFESAYEAGRQLNRNSKNIHHALKTGGTGFGYFWKYKIEKD